MPRADLVIKGATVVTMDRDRGVIPDAGIAVTDDRIVAVGSRAELDKYDSAREIEASGQALLPGFVNAHCHCTHNLMRGGPCDDRVLYDWLVNGLNPAMKAYQPGDPRVAAELYCVESIRAGITTTVDNEDYSRHDHICDEAMAVYQDMGIRIIYGDSFFDLIPEEWVPYIEACEAKEPEINHDHDILEKTGEALARIQGRIDRYHGSGDGRIQVWPEPCIACMTTREGLVGVKDLARKNGTRITLHASQSNFDKFQNGMSSVEYLETCGFWGPEVLAAHMVQVEPNDLRIMKRYDVKVAHNAVSNLFVADGIAPVMEYATAGLTVGIGTDDCNANQSACMLSDMKVAALAQKVRYLSSAAMTAEKVLEMATIDGARAVGMDEDIGSVEVGKKADVILVDLLTPQTTPCHNVPSALVYHSYGHEVATVLVDGQVLMEDHQLTRMTSDEEAGLLRRAQDASHAVLERAGMQKLRDREWRSVP
jgi:cytosine/adenosine deaminase-related metal-dependent hydrolase